MAVGTVSAKGAHGFIYVPHGAIPDRRGFSPAIVAWEFAKRTRVVQPFLFCARETYSAGITHCHGISIERLSARRFYSRLRKLGLVPRPALPRALVAACETPLPHLVHAHQLEFDVAELRRRTRRAVPVVIHAHVLSQNPCSSRGIADAYVAVSDFVKTCLCEMGYPPDRVTTIRNGVDTTLFAPPTSLARHTLRQQWGIPEEAAVLAFVGRKHDVKGFPAFLAVAERLLASDRAVWVMSIGADPERPSHEAGFLANQSRLQRVLRHPRYRSFGAVSQTELAALYKMIDVTLVPSLAETQGMVMIESLAAGCVTISSRVGGIAETITNGVTGYLVDEPRDTQELYRVTCDVLDRLSDLSDVRAAARAFAVTTLDWQARADQLDQLYLSVLSRP